MESLEHFGINKKFIRGDMKSYNWQGNIEESTIKNPNYRKVIETNKHSQLVLMSLKPRESIGTEQHKNIDQFFRIEQGKALFTLDKGKKKFIGGPADAVLVPAGTWHNVTNIGTTQLKLYTIYSPPNHPPGTIQKDKPKNDYNSRKRSRRN